jgi:hypothetical protein
MVIAKYRGFRFLRLLVTRCKYHPPQKTLISLTDHSSVLLSYGFYMLSRGHKNILFSKQLSENSLRLNSEMAIRKTIRT